MTQVDQQIDALTRQREKAMNYIGIDIGGTNLKAGLGERGRRILAMETRKCARSPDHEPDGDTGGADPSLPRRGGLTHG